MKPTDWYVVLTVFIHSAFNVSAEGLIWDHFLFLEYRIWCFPMIFAPSQEYWLGVKSIKILHAILSKLDVSYLSLHLTCDGTVVGKGNGTFLCWKVAVNNE